MSAPSASSLIDRVNDADEPVGQVRRDAVFASRAGFRVVHVFVRNATGNLLLQRVGASRERSPLLWGSSVAGYLFAGESYAEGARRRLVEELGVQSAIRKVGAVRMHDNGATKFITLFETEAERPRVNDDEHIESIEFRTPAEIAEMLRGNPQQFTETFPIVFQLFRGVA